MHWIDPTFLPETGGTLERFLLSPEGETDGFLLADGTEVHVPPHLGALLREAVLPGAYVRVRGVRPRGLPDMIAAVAVETPTVRLADHGPPGGGAPHPNMHRAAATGREERIVRGTVRRALHGAKGELCGVLLAEGAIGRFPPRAADARLLIVPGTTLTMRGPALDTPDGPVLAVREIGGTDETLRPLGTVPGLRTGAWLPVMGNSHAAPRGL